MLSARVALGASCDGAGPRAVTAFGPSLTGEKGYGFAVYLFSRKKILALTFFVHFWLFHALFPPPHRSLRFFFFPFFSGRPRLDEDRRARDHALAELPQRRTWAIKQARRHVCRTSTGEASFAPMCGAPKAASVAIAWCGGHGVATGTMSCCPAAAPPCSRK